MIAANGKLCHNKCPLLWHEIIPFAVIIFSLCTCFNCAHNFCCIISSWNNMNVRGEASLLKRAHFPFYLPNLIICTSIFCSSVSALSDRRLSVSRDIQILLHMIYTGFHISTDLQRQYLNAIHRQCSTVVWHLVFTPWSTDYLLCCVHLNWPVAIPTCFIQTMGMHDDCPSQMRLS